MAKKYSGDIRIFYDGYDIGTAMTSVQLSVAVDPLDPTSLGDTAERVISGKRNDVLEVSGLYDDGVDALNAAQALLSNGTGIFSVAIGNSIGNQAYAGKTFFLAMKDPANIGDLIKQEASFRPDQAIDRGIILTPKETISGTSSQTGTNDNSAASTNGGTLYLHDFSHSGAGTGTIALDHSTDGTTWAAKGTVVGLVSQYSAASAFTGTINRYTRLTRGGAGTSDSIASILVRS